MKIGGWDLIFISSICFLSSLILSVKITDYVYHISTGFYNFNFEPLITFFRNLIEKLNAMGFISFLLGVASLFLNSFRGWKND